VFHFLHVCGGGERNKTIEKLFSSSHKFNRYKRIMCQEERKPLKVTFIVSFGVEFHNLVIWFCYNLGKCWKFLKAHDIIIVDVHVGKANDEDIIYVKPKGNTIAKWSNVHYKNSWHFKLSINLVILFVMTTNLINLIRSPKLLKWLFFLLVQLIKWPFWWIIWCDIYSNMTQKMNTFSKKWHGIK
jgi:hypothetical protein